MLSCSEQFDLSKRYNEDLYDYLLELTPENLQDLKKDLDVLLNWGIEYGD
jgi:hypothetical protein